MALLCKVDKWEPSEDTQYQTWKTILVATCSVRGRGQDRGYEIAIVMSLQTKLTNRSLLRKVAAEIAKQANLWRRR